MRRFALVAAALIGFALPEPADAACGFERIAVTGTVGERADVCRALSEVMGYFQAIGFDPVPQADIAFRDVVVIDLYRPNPYRPRLGETVRKQTVLGYYSFPTKALEVTSARRGHQGHRQPWEIEWGAGIAYSILQHELVHAIVANLLGEDYPSLGKAWHEFVAYSVQFAIMEPELRRRILDNFPDARPFRAPENINPTIHAVAPDTFGVRAYLYYEANGGPGLIRGILEKTLPFSTTEVECLCAE